MLKNTCKDRQWVVECFSDTDFPMHVVPVKGPWNGLLLTNARCTQCCWFDSRKETIQWKLDGCIVWNAHNTLFGWKPYHLVTIHQDYRQTDRQRCDVIEQIVLQTKISWSPNTTWPTWTWVIWVFRRKCHPASCHIWLCSKSFDNSHDDSLSLSSPPLASSQNNSSSTFPLSFAFLAIFLFAVA